MRYAGAVALISMAMLEFHMASAQTWHCGVELKRDTVAASGAAGWDFGHFPSAVKRGSCSAKGSFYFSMPASDGNYRVTVDLGGPEAADTSIKAEARRLMVLHEQTTSGSHKTVTFIVNVRTPRISGTDHIVKLKPRELSSMDWDGRLELEFAGFPSIRSIRVETVNVPTIYLAGDSTVVDQAYEPWAAWGQMFPYFLKPEVGVANIAESGETMASFEQERRFEKIFSQIRPGDYLFIQFGHNDQKPGEGFVSTEQYMGLLEKYVAVTRARGATPVLVTSVNRRTFKANGTIKDTLAPYPQLMRTLASNGDITLIDLNRLSAELYQSIGEPNSHELFVYVAADTYPNQHQPLHDDTHFNDYGAYELAAIVASSIAQSSLPLKAFVKPQHSVFDLRHRDAPENVRIPSTPFVEEITPSER